MNDQCRHRAWVITSYRAGDHAQILALADALGVNYEIRRVSRNLLASFAGFLRRTTSIGISKNISAELRPPWPDLIISAGMRNEPVCRWIRSQSNNQARLVFVGRTWASPDNFDLIVTTPQYRVPDHPKVLQNKLTLNKVTSENLEKAAEEWSSRLSRFPHPRIGVIVGGNSGPYTLGPRAARRLGQCVNDTARKQEGSLLVTTSARTPANAIQPLKESISVPAHFHEWSDSNQDNPYLGYLALADELVVTADSIAMLSEAFVTGKPIYIFDPDQEKTARDFRAGAFLYKGLMRWGPKRLTRDVSIVHQHLINTGRAAWLGEPVSKRGDTSSDDMTRAVERVKRLLVLTDPTDFL